MSVVTISPFSGLNLNPDKAIPAPAATVPIFPTVPSLGKILKPLCAIDLTLANKKLVALNLLNDDNKDYTYHIVKLNEVLTLTKDMEVADNELNDFLNGHEVEHV